MNKQNENEYVQICFGCCQNNNQNSKTLPLICPRINMPCMAIEPQYLTPKVSEEMVLFLEKFNKGSEEVRIPIHCKYIDQDFVKSRCSIFSDLEKQGNKTIYTMQAY